MKARQSDYMTWNLPNPLPNDGYPRITYEGYEILREGLNGNFDRWCDSIGNHPLAIGHDKCRNIYISCCPEKRHFQINIWFGQKSPMVEYSPIAPTIEFDTIDTLRREAIDNIKPKELPPKDRIMLKNSKDGFFTTGIMILLDDYGVNAKKRTYYKCFESKAAFEDDEDEEYEDEECTCIKPTEPAKQKVKSLECWL